MPSTLSTQKRALPAQAMEVIPDWSSLPGDLVRRIGDCFMVGDDLDYYMDFRVVCKNWRSNSDRPTNKGIDDPRFQPSKWALLERHDDVDIITLMNASTGRFLSKSIPILLKYFFVGSTSGGLILLGEKEYPYQARVLNPFTGSITHFKARVPKGGVRAVVVTTSPFMIFISSEDEGHIMWADQNSTRFHTFWGRYPEKPMCMMSFADNVYFTDNRGSILSIVVDAAANGRCSAQTISVASIIPTPDPSRRSYYLVESGGELLLVTRRWYDIPEQLVVHKVDTMRMVLEPVTISNYALFVSRVRCLSVDANKFQTTIEGNCIYYVDEFMLDLGTIGGCFRPLTLDRNIVDYCKAIHYSELSQMFDSEVDFSDESESEDESFESDIRCSEENLPDESGSEDEFFESNIGCFEPDE